MSVGVFGEGVIDRFITPDGTHDVIGGSALNAAVALRRSGVDAMWCSRVSLDDDGEIIATYAHDNCVSSQRMLRRPEPTSVVTIETDSNGFPSYSFRLDGAVDWQWDHEELIHVLADLEVLQLSSLSCVLSPGADFLPEAIRELKTSNPQLTITFDPNARPRAAKDERHANQMRMRIEDLVHIANLVKVSDEDLEWLHPDHSPQSAALRWSTLGPQLVVLTRGALGAQAFIDGKQIAEIPGITTNVVDTVGAGDTFMAWLIRGIVEDHHNRIPQELEAIELLLTQAAQAAAITCSRKGCKPPLRSEVL